jgi:hypothetical protein
MLELSLENNARLRRGPVPNTSIQRIPLTSDAAFEITAWGGFWGGWWDSNPRQPEPQSGVLPLNYTHHTQRKIIAFSAAALFAAQARRRPAKQRQTVCEEALIYLAAAIHHATVRLSATRRRRRSLAALADGEGRKLLFQPRGVALRAFGLLFAEEDSLKPVPALFATVFENWHTFSRTLRKAQF